MPRIHTGRPAAIRAPSPERRAAVVVHPVGHSVGLLVTDADLVSPSFRVDADGTVTAVAGWGHAGPTADLVDRVSNPPPSATVVHTVQLAGDGPDVLAGVRTLIEEHLARYADCQVWLVPGASRELQEWVAVGCPGRGDPAGPEPPAVSA